MADLKSNAAADAIEEAVRRKTVGIVHGSGSDKWRGIGTGTLVVWKGRRFVLTADHVIRDTKTADLRFFLPSVSPPEKVERHELLQLRGVDTANLNQFVEFQLISVFRNQALDLAVIDVDPRAGLPEPAEFFELEQGAASPATGATVTLTGFPQDISRQTEEGHFVVFTHAEWSDVIDAPDGLDGFDPRIHIAVPYAAREQYGDALPHGLSGSAAWFRRGTTPGVWHANLELGGVTISWYKRPNLLKVIRREIVEGFLQQDTGGG